MKCNIGFILLLHFVAINYSHSITLIKNCEYIANRTDEVEIFCKNMELPYLYNEYHFNESEELHSSGQQSVCYQNLFIIDSQETNRLSVKLLKSSTVCNFQSISPELFPNIREWDFSSSQMRSLYNSYFGHTQNYEKLIKWNVSHNYMPVFSLSLLHNMPNLYEIDLSYNSIEIITGEISDKNTELSVVNLSHNNLTSFYSFMSSDIIIFIRMMTKLKLLDLSYNKITYIQQETFQNNINLEDLRLDNNPLTAFDCNLFSPLRSLASLTATLDTIKQMKINSEKCTLDIASDNTSEIAIHISGVKNKLRYKKDYFEKIQLFTMVEKETENILKIFKLLPSSLLVLDLASINLKGHLDNILNKFSNLEFLNLSNSNLIDLEPKMFSHQSKLGTLDLSYNHLKISNPTALFKSLEKLYKLRLANAHLQNIPEILQSLSSSLTELDLSFNYVGKLNATTFQRFTKLQHLNLSHTHLSNFGFNTFYHQTRLQILDLSHNHLMSVDFTLFVRNFQHLYALHLGGNNLSDFSTMNPSVFPHLNILTISENQPSCHSLVPFLHQWKHVNFFGNPSMNQTHMNGIDCSAHDDQNAKGETTKTSGIFVSHTEINVIKYSVLFLCVMCLGYLVVKSKLIKRLKEKLAENSPYLQIPCCRKATSAFVLVEPEIL